MKRNDIKETSFTLLMQFVRYIKPDFRKFTGWLYITSGLFLIAPPFLQQLVLSILTLDDRITLSVENDATIGSMLLLLGALYHLLYITSINHKRQAENYTMVTLVISLVGMIIYVSLLHATS